MKFRKSFGNTKLKTLEYRLQLCKHELEACSEKLKYEKLKRARQTINRQFSCDQKSVFRKMRGQDVIPETIPEKHEVESFWSSIWGQQGTSNNNPMWLNELRGDYCRNTQQSRYEISKFTMEEVLSKLQNNKAPGPDLIVGYWYKNLSFYRESLCKLYDLCLHGGAELPDWLTTARTQLVPKSHETHLANNYRPIACQNLMYKMYTSCLNSFLQDHCHRNNVIATEQAGGKKES